MLSPNGEIVFTQELMDMIDQFLDHYQELRGPLRNELERGLIIAYVLGVVRCDLENIWDSLGQAEVFGSLQPRILFEECAQRDQQIRQARRAGIVEEITRRGWLSDEPIDAKAANGTTTAADQA